MLNSPGGADTGAETGADTGADADAVPGAAATLTKAAGPPGPRAPAKGGLGGLRNLADLRNLSLLGVLAVLAVVGGITKPDEFLSTDNLQLVLTQASVIGVVTVGVTFVITSGGMPST